MKKFNSLLFFVLIASLSLFLGCSKDSDILDVPEVNTPDMEFTIEGKGVRKFSSSWLLYSPDYLRIDGPSSYNKPHDVWQITLTGPSEIGTYNIGANNLDDSNYYAVIADGPFCFDYFDGCPPLNRFVGKSGTITITHSAEDRVKGTFDFVAQHRGGLERVVHSGWFDIKKKE